MSVRSASVPNWSISFCIAHCNTLQHTATHCNTLTRYNTLQDTLADECAQREHAQLQHIVLHHGSALEHQRRRRLSLEAT